MDLQRSAPFFSSTSSTLDVASAVIGIGIGIGRSAKAQPRCLASRGKRHRSGVSFGAHDTKSQHLLRMRLRKARSNVELQHSAASSQPPFASQQSQCCSASAKINQLLNKATASRRSSVSLTSGNTSSTHPSSPAHVTPTRVKLAHGRPDKLMVHTFRQRMWSLPPTSVNNSSTLQVPDTPTDSLSSVAVSPSDSRGCKKVTQDDMTLSNRFSSLEIGRDDRESNLPEVFAPDPRQRSYTMAVRTQSIDQVAVMNAVYKERFPLATSQMEEKLEQLIANIDKRVLQSFESSAIERFVLVQLDEMSKDVLQKSREHQLSTRYFYDATDNVDKLLADAREKSLDQSSVDDVARLVKMFLLIIARPARLLECLEFDPAEFYQLLTAAESRVKDVVKTDVPKYIMAKLGLRYGETEHVAITPECDSKACVLKDAAAEAIPAPSEGDFETIKLVSNGAYGAVYLVRHKETRQRYALKKIRKQDLMLRNQVDQVYAERDIMIFLDNPFVVTLYCTFETKKHLCLVMEYVEGGDVATLLKHMGPLTLDLARMYFAETVLALEYLHSYGIVHRDLKPDNLLITSTGHVKLTDFGLSKIGLMNLTTIIYEGTAVKKWSHFKDKQVFGTPTYIAPEVILRQGYGMPVDWWALGIILYEFLVGCVPFYGESPEDLFQAIIEGEIEWPEGDLMVPKEAKALIIALLQQNPSKRLGTNGPQEVREHSFFESTDWQGLLRIKAEFIPSLTNEEDTSYFDTRQDRYNHEADDEPIEVESHSGSMASLSTCSSSLASLGLSSAMLARGTSHESADDRGSDDEVMFHGFTSLTPRYARTCQTQRHSSVSEGGGSRSSVSGSQITMSLSTADFGESSVPQATSAEQVCHNHNVSLEKPMLPIIVNERSDSDLAVDALTTRQKKATATAIKTGLNNDCGKAMLPSLAPQIAVISPESPSPTTRSPVRGELRSWSNFETQEHVKATEAIGKSVMKGTAPQLLVTIVRGPRGFGFTFRTIRVYYGDSDVYTLQHLITDVDSDSGAFQAGLRQNYLITHINGETLQGLLHTEVIKLVFQSGAKISVQAKPLESTSIRTRAACSVTQKPAQSVRSHIGPNYGRMLRRLNRPKEAMSGKGAAQRGKNSVAMQAQSNLQSRKKAGLSGNPTNLIRRLSSRRAENQLQEKISATDSKSRMLPRRWHSQQTQKIESELTSLQLNVTSTPDSSGINSPQTPTNTVSVTLTSDSPTCSPLPMRSPKSPSKAPQKSPIKSPLKSPKHGRRAPFTPLPDSSSSSSSAFSSGSHDTLQIKSNPLLQIQTPLAKLADSRSAETRKSWSVTSPLARQPESEICSAKGEAASRHDRPTGTDSSARKKTTS